MPLALGSNIRCVPLCYLHESPGISDYGIKKVDLTRSGGILYQEAR